MSASSFGDYEHHGQWNVGDKVAAYNGVEKKWREVFIREVCGNAVDVICLEDEKAEAFWVKTTDIRRLDKISVETLNMIKYDVVKECEEKVINEEKVKVDMKALTPSILLAAGDEDLCLIARSGVGSRYLQSLVSPDNRKLCEKMVSAIMNTNPLRMMTNPASCFLVKKLVSFIHILPKFQQDDLLAHIESNFSKLSLSAYGYHVVLAIVTYLGEEYRKPFILKLENRVMLISLVKSKFGTFIAQACVPCMQERTIISVVNTLLGHVVELGCHPSATFFIQHFLVSWGTTKSFDLLVEHILRHLRQLVHNPHGHYVIQSLMNTRPDIQLITIITKWFVRNMMACYKDKHAVQVIRCLLYHVGVQMVKDKDTKWSKVLDMMMNKLIEVVEDGRPLLIQAACHPMGHLVVMGLVKMLMKMETVMKKKTLEVITMYRATLSSDPVGNVIVKNAELL